MNWRKPRSGVWELWEDGRMLALVRRRRIDFKWIVVLPGPAEGSPVSPAYHTAKLAMAAAESRLAAPPVAPPRRPRPSLFS